jgi:hypothetical protein
MKKSKCPKTGITFEGTIIAKELGIEEPPKFVEPVVTDRMLAPGATNQQLNFHDQECEFARRMRGEPVQMADIHNHLIPSTAHETKSLRFTNKTLDDVKREWRSQARAHQRSVAQDARDPTLARDPVTGTYYHSQQGD